MTKEQFEELLRSYGFVNSTYATPRGPDWWTYGGYRCDNYAFLINNDGTAYIYPHVYICPITLSLQFVRTNEYDENAHDFLEIAPRVPEFVNNIKNSIKIARKKQIEEL